MSECIEQPRYTCALGAQQTVLAIKRAIPIIHAGPGCSKKIFGALATSAGFQGEGYMGGDAVPCTNASESEVVFGGEEKLRSTINGTLKLIDGDLFVVLTGCTSDIVGDDVGQVVEDYRSRGVPIINAETGGFKGNNYTGHELVLDALINQFLGDATPNIQKGLVNIFSVIPYQNAFWRADLEALQTLLAKIGLKANILFGHTSDGVEGWKNVPNAQFNLVVAPWVGLKAAETLQEKFGTPYLHYPVLPVGAIESSRFLRKVGAFAGVPDTLIEQVIKDEEARYYDYLIGMTDLLVELRAALPYKFYNIADANYALGISQFLINELGFLPEEQYIIDNPPEEYLEQIENAFQSISEDIPISVISENDGGKIQLLIREKKHKTNEVLILGSAWDQNLAKELNGFSLNISIPVSFRLVLNRTYVGYNGGLNLAEDIYSNVLNM